MLNNIDLDKLKILRELDRTNSLLKASKRLNVTPSAVSQSLQTLEGQLNAQLFVRSGKKYFTTPFGKQILSAFSPFYSQLETQLSEAYEGENKIMGEVRVHAPNNFARSILSKVICNFLSKYPDSRFDIDIGSPDQGLKELIGNRVDFAFSGDKNLFKTNTKIQGKLINQGELILVCSRKFYCKHIDGDESYSNLKDLNHIASSSNQESLASFYKKIFKKTPLLKSQLTAYDLSLILDAVKSHLGLAIVPSYTVQGEISKGTLVQVAKKSAPHPKYLCWLKGKSLRLIEKSFVDYLEKHA